MKKKGNKKIHLKVDKNTFLNMVCIAYAYDKFLKVTPAMMLSPTSPSPCLVVDEEKGQLQCHEYGIIIIKTTKACVCTDTCVAVDIPKGV